MYLIIYEDGSMFKVAEFTNIHAEACDAGVMDVVRLDGENPTRYVNGNWESIEWIGRD